jgi:dipeptidyl aminopeptidase/acylaminoacyl peptidase
MQERKGDRLMSDIFRLNDSGKAQYTEIASRDGLMMRGFLHVPDGASPQNKVPLVIIMHGFTSNRIGNGKSNMMLAWQLCREGIASLRMDFIGSGESDGNFEDMTVLTELRDAEDLLQYAKTLDFVDPARIAVHGMSQGGLEAMLLAGTHPEEIACVSLWSPGFSIGLEWDNTMISPEDIEKIKRQGYFDCASWKVGKGYYDDAVNTDSYSIAAQYHGPVQIVHGTQDEVVPLRYSMMLREVLGDSCHLITVEGANHDYESLYWNGLRLQYAVDFLKAQLLQ